MHNEGYRSTEFSFRQADVLCKNFYNSHSDLESRFDFVHSANVIHLFPHAKQLVFLRALVFLAKPGGLIWGRQVGLTQDENTARYRQPEGKGARYTLLEFRSLIVEATGWDDNDVSFEGQLSEYEELRVARPDKRWVLQWCLRVPTEKSFKVGRIAELDYTV